MGRTILLRLLGITAIAFGMTACAGKFPVPGGSDDVNKGCFASIPDMQSHILKLNPGMPEGEALAALCRKKQDFARLSRREVRIALLGGDNVSFSADDGEASGTDSEMIRSLYGYKIKFKNTRKKHGFSSPIRIQTNEVGYDYTITLVFKDGILFEKPILSGGLVNENTSDTIFDFITPGTVIDKAVPD